MINTLPQLLKQMEEVEESNDVEIKLVIYSDGAGSVYAGVKQLFEFDDLAELAKKLV